MSLLRPQLAAFVRLYGHLLFLLLLGSVIISAILTGAALAVLVLSLFAALYVSAARREYPHSTTLRRVIFIAGILLIALAAFNYVINPFGLYTTRYFEPIILSSRTEKMRLYTARPEVPQALILGSSRSFSVDPEQVEALWGYPTFNASVGSGTISDHLAFLYFASRMRAVPRLLILNVEFDSFLHGDSAQAEPNATLWRYLEDANALSVVTNGWEQFSHLFTLEQVQASLRLLEAERQGRTKGFYTFLPNGHVQVNEPLSLEEAVNGSLANNIAAGWGAVYSPSNIDSSKTDLLRQLLEFARQQKIMVLGYIPPLHPQFLDYLDRNSEFRSFQSSLTQTYRDFEQVYPFHFIDFTDSSLFRGDHLDALFSDGVHLKEAGSSLIIQALYDAFPKGS